MSSIGNSTPDAGKGFTLLEMLVVLVLFSLTGTLLMQGYTQLLQLRSRFMEQLKQQQVTTLQRHWLHSVIAGAFPDRPNGAHIFNADRKRLQGLTIGALDANAGAPYPFELVLESGNAETALRYKTGAGAVWTLAVWPQPQITFGYQDHTGQWHSTWPPKTPQSTDQLPVAVRIGAEAPGATAADGYIAINGRTQAKTDVRDSELFQ